MAQNDGASDYNLARAELFEALGHPTRVKVIEVLGEGPLGFSELKRRVGIESSGHMTFHLDKLDCLVKTTQGGSYALTDDGKEALRLITTMNRVNSHIRSEVGTRDLSRARRRATLVGIVMLLVGVIISVSLLQGQITSRDAQIEALRAQTIKLQQHVSELLALISQLHYTWSSNDTWLFKGAYAVYKGENMGYVSGPPGQLPNGTFSSNVQHVLFRLTVRWEVLEYNGTHARIFLSNSPVSVECVVEGRVIPYDGDWIELGKEF